MKLVPSASPEFSDILWHPTKIYGPKVFLLTKIKPEYSNILYNLTHFPGPLVCRIRQVPLYIHIVLVSCWVSCVNHLITTRGILLSIVMQLTQLTRHDISNCTNIFKHIIRLPSIFIGQAKSDNDMYQYYIYSLTQKIVLCDTYFVTSRHTFHSFKLTVRIHTNWDLLHEMFGLKCNCSWYCSLQYGTEV